MPDEQITIRSDAGETHSEGVHVEPAHVDGPSMPAPTNDAPHLDDDSAAIRTAQANAINKTLPNPNADISVDVEIAKDVEVVEAGKVTHRIVPANVRNDGTAVTHVAVGDTETLEQETTKNRDFHNGTAELSLNKPAEPSAFPAGTPIDAPTVTPAPGAKITRPALPYPRDLPY